MGILLYYGWGDTPISGQQSSTGSVEDSRPVGPPWFGPAHGPVLPRDSCDFVKNEEDDVDEEVGVWVGRGGV